MTRLTERLERVNQVSTKKEKTLENKVHRAREHADHVVATLQSKRQRDQEQLKDRVRELSERMRQAEENREAVKQKKIEVAQAFQGRSVRSVSKDVPATDDKKE